MNERLRFEIATEEDAQQILALYRSLVGTPFCVWNENYPSESEIEFDLSRDALFVIKDIDGTIAGTISADLDENVSSLDCWSKDLEPSVELSRLGVNEKYQNKGIAGELLKNMMKKMKDQGMRSVHFLVCKKNIKAIKAYNKLTFNVVGECRLYDEDYYCYERDLKDYEY